MGVNTDKLVENAFSMINSLSMYEQKIARADDLIEEIQSEIKKVQEDKEKPGMQKALEINVYRAQIEKAEKARKEIISNRDEIDAHYSQMVDLVKENGLEDELIAALTGTKILLGEQINLLPTTKDLENDSEAKLQYKLCKVAYNIFETAIESLKGIEIDDPSSPDGFGGR